MDVKKGEIFNSIQVPQLPRNTFDLSHQHVTTMDFADLVPICVMEAVPGDIFNISSDTFIRLQPLITPMMHRCDFTVHYFYVPNRILWDGWEDFITGNLALTSGLSTPAAPFITSNAIHAAAGDLDGRRTLLNYMGMEVQACTKLNSTGVNIQINALPVAAYQKIYWDYYVPKELVGPGVDFVKLVDGDNSSTVTTLLGMKQKGWVRDYFTSALPYAQKGDQVAIPMEGTVTALQAGDTGLTAGGWKRASNGTTITPTNNVTNVGGSTTIGGELAYYDPNGTLLLENTTTTINDLRRAIRLQEWLEKNARAGTRYSESLKAHFDVTSSDARLQRAEYITGIKSPIIVSEVLNTAGEVAEGGLPQGNMSGHAIGIADSYGDSFFCEEHGFVIGLLSVTPKPAYTTGLPRWMVKRFDNLDYYWNEFANIGEQEILNVELQTSLGALEWDGTFGYTPRYSEYKFKNDMITGDFADGGSSDLGSLRSWVMQRSFGSDYSGIAGELSQYFITADIKSVAGAVFAVEDTPIMVQQINKLKVSRLMPVYGTPTF